MKRATVRAALGCLTAAGATLLLALRAAHPVFADDTRPTQADSQCQAYHNKMQGRLSDVSYSMRTIQWCLKAEQGSSTLAAMQSGEAQQFTELRHAHAMQYGAEATMVAKQEPSRPLDVFRKANRINHAIFHHSRSVKIHDQAAGQFMEVNTLIAYAKGQVTTRKTPKT